MQSRATILILPMLALLAGCHATSKDGDAGAEQGVSISVKDDDGGDTKVAATAQGVSVNAPGFSGKLNLPGLSIGGDDIDLDGMKLYPGSKVTGVDVDAHGEDKGLVRIAFRSDAAPAKIVDYYRTAATDAGYQLAAAGAGSDQALSGTKSGGKHFALSVKPGASGATGTILMSGS